ncbi:hypothetical protein C1I59_07440 [Paenibacillus polymyxa]|uniref:hypothetical protein n=2 Tax=Paenibacillus polymyxa TaxID=1406 RepID=UPI0010BE9360|nr:hypothetical protein [Paenibacillus polymyxa]TKH39075.1 hypothetical protein C1I59_07440 [Paenibacillus polymyxa]
MKKGIKISGAVFATKGNIDHDEFIDKFIEFVESNGWEFGGGSRLIDEDGNDIKEIKYDFHKLI